MITKINIYFLVWLFLLLVVITKFKISGLIFSCVRARPGTGGGGTGGGRDGGRGLARTHEKIRSYNVRVYDLCMAYIWPYVKPHVKPYVKLCVRPYVKYWVVITKGCDY